MIVKVETVAEHKEDSTQAKKAAAARVPLRLAKLLRGVDVSVDPKKAVAHGDLEILEIAYDSRRVKPGTLFVATRGEKTDGNQFVPDALARGAIAIASEQPPPRNL
ncbi:MAG: Mur ligase domain-containing protein, partial [Candidatus Acidiferrum sp.]